MRARLNYTGRKKIPRKSVSIVMSATEPRRFAVNWKDLDLPASAVVYVEAYSSGSPTVMRFAWGTVGTPKQPSDNVLTDVVGDSVSFDLKVVDDTEAVGRILGVCRNIRPRDPKTPDAGDVGKVSLLPVNPVDLGEQVWRISFVHDRPWLDVNKNVPGIMEIVRTDRRFFALVFPAAIQQILQQILIVSEIFGPDDAESEWQSLWLRWAIHWHPDHELPPQGDEESTERNNWIADVVESFCSRHSTVTMFRDALESEGAAK